MNCNHIIKYYWLQIILLKDKSIFDFNKSYKITKLSTLYNSFTPTHFLVVTITHLGYSVRKLRMMCTALRCPRILTQYQPHVHRYVPSGSTTLNNWHWLYPKGWTDWNWENGIVKHIHLPCRPTYSCRCCHSSCRWLSHSTHPGVDMWTDSVPGNSASPHLATHL